MKVKIYLAGYGHDIENTDFVFKKDIKYLISYAMVLVDKGKKDRFRWICRENRRAERRAKGK